MAHITKKKDIIPGTVKPLGPAKSAHETTEEWLKRLALGEVEKALGRDKLDDSEIKN